MRRVFAMLALACAVLGVASASAREGAAPSTFCWEFDRLGADGADRVDGTSEPDHVATFGGDDHVRAFGGADCVSAGAGHDELDLGPGDDEGLGRGGHDVLLGGTGSDRLLGGLGADRIDGGDGDDVLADDPADRARDVMAGGPGSDRLHAGLGADVLHAGPGADTVLAANGGIDDVDCGDDYDRAFADRGDRLVGCERVVIGYRPAVRRTPASGTRRTTFRLSWDGDDPVRIDPAGYAPGRAGCARGSWRLRTGRGRARVRWAGRARPCPGRYAWRVVRVGAEGPPVDCESAADPARDKGAPLGNGCSRAETIGEVSFVVKR